MNHIIWSFVKIFSVMSLYVNVAGEKPAQISLVFNLSFPTLAS